MYLKIAEFLVICVTMWLCITQIIIPGFYGTKSFPIFKKEAKLKEKLVEIKQEFKEKELEKTIDQIKEKLEEKPPQTKKEKNITKKEGV